MKLYTRAVELIAGRVPFAWAAVIHTTGSTPQKAGAKALFLADGRVLGTLGGGCLEAEARRRALDALDLGTTLDFGLNLDEVDGWDDGLVCGGKARILAVPRPEENAAAYAAVQAAFDEKTSGVLVTVVQHPALEAGRAFWIDAGATSLPEALDGLCAEAIHSALEAEQPRLIEQERDGVPYVYFVEPMLPPPLLVIAGAGHIGTALARFGATLGFEVAVIDDRPVFAHADRLPEAHQVICGDIPSETARLADSPRAYVVIVTRGHRHDGDTLAACIHADCAYLGLIGSKRKSLLLRRHLVDAGIASQSEVDRVVSPIGLDIGGRTVEEIALSVAAQLVAVRRKQSLHATPLHFAFHAHA